MNATNLPSPSDIAIVGMACELPGQADTLAGFEHVLMHGIDATSALPAERFDSATRDGLAAAARHGGYLQRSPWMFDAGCFGIAPKEAAYMDPQHRLLLECAYHALEDAGLDPAALRGNPCGVFVGVSTSDFGRRMAASGDYNGYLSRGALGSMAAGRLSYHFGLEGPSLVVDTACSSSLVALHQAISALREGRCGMAIVAGVSLILAHDYSADLAAAGMLAADGRCKPFTRHADGFSRGEGVGAIVLLPAADAAARGMRAYAHVLGSAINSDGRSNGITAPSKSAQRRLMEQALHSAGLTPAQVSHIETHGTGTALGDRIELDALGEVFGRRDTPLFLGAAKANIAHCEGAAGIAGIIKMALSLHRRRIAPHCFAHDIDAAVASALPQAVLPAQALAWPGDSRRIGGVSSFGMSGSNAHVLLGEAADAPLAAPEVAADGPQLLQLSARSTGALQALAQDYAGWLAQPDAPAAAAVCHAALFQRQQWNQARLSVAGNNASELAAQLLRRLDTPLRPRPASARVALVFTGQGSQYTNMARQLYQQNTLFRSLLEPLAARLDHLAGEDTHILDALFAGDAELRQPSGRERQRSAQLSLFLIEYTLAEFWRALGLRPVAVLGHSVGEYAAACVAGVMDFDVAVRMLLARADAMEAACAASDSAMLAVSATPQQLAPLLARICADEPALWIAVRNSAQSVVVAGRATALAQLSQAAADAGLVCTPLATRGAFHTPLMAPAAAQFAAACAAIAPALRAPAAAVRFYSSVDSDDPAALEQGVDQLRYWSEQIQTPVNFADAIARLLADGPDLVLEIGPRAVLTPLTASAARLAGRAIVCLPSLDMRHDDVPTVLRALGSLSEHGALDPRQAMRQFAVQAERPVPAGLPLYPFQREHVQPASWQASLPARGGAAMAPVPPVAALAIRHELSLDPQAGDSWLQQHVIDGAAVLPGMYYLSSAFSLAQRWLPQAADAAAQQLTLRDLLIHQPLALAADAPAALTVDIGGPDTRQSYQLRYSAPGHARALHAEVRAGWNAMPQPDNADAPGTAAQWDDAAPFYDHYRARGVSYGPLFQRVQASHRVSDSELWGRILPPEAPTASLPLWHAALLDNCLHTLGICAGDPQQAYVPVSVGSAWFDASAAWNASILCQAVLRPAPAGFLDGELRLYSGQGRCIGVLSEVSCAALGAAAMPAALPLHAVDWVAYTAPAGLPARPAAGEQWLLAAAANSSLPAACVQWLAEADVHTRHAQWDADGKLHGAESATAPLRTILVLLDPAHPQPADAAALAHWVRGWRETLQVLLDRQPGQPLQLCLADVAAHADGEAAHTRRALAQALATNLRSELPALDVSWLDSDADGAAIAAAACAVRAQPAGLADGGIAASLWRLRAGILAQRRTLRVAQPTAPDQPCCRADGTYWISGVFGGIGRHLAEHLVRHAGCRSLVLITRAAPTEEQQAWLAQLATQGVALQLLLADLNDTASASAALDACGAPMHGLFHLAGSLDDRPIGDIDAAQLQQVLGAKLGGAWLLHRHAARHAELDYFVLFSSLAALLESPGQLAYTAANAGLQLLAAQRRHDGLPATVIDWGPWDGAGMMRGLAQGKRSRALRQLAPMAPARGCATLAALLAGPERDGHYAVYALAPAAAAGQEQPCASAGANADGDLLAQLIASETGHAASTLDEQATLEQLGLDSVGLIRIRSELQSQLGHSIPVALLLAGGTLAELRQRLAGLQPAAAAQAPETVPDAGPATPRIPLSPGQFSLWYEQQRQDAGNAYQCAIGWRIDGTGLDMAALQARWEALIAAHELLRATVDGDDQETGPAYVVHAPATVQAANAIRQQPVQDEAAALAHIADMLAMAPSLHDSFATRVTLLRAHDGTGYLVLSSNHVLMDASAMFYVGQQLAGALCGLAPADSPGPVAQYRDFAASQRQLGADAVARAADHIAPQLLAQDGSLLRLDLPYERTPAPSAAGDSVAIPLSAEAMQRLRALPASRRASVCLAAWLLLLARYSGQQRVLTGVAFNGRTQQRWRHTVGHFVNVLPLVLDIDENGNSTALERSVSGALFDLLDFQDIPLAQLMRDERLKAAVQGHDPLQSYFNFFDATEMHLEAGAARLTPLTIPQQLAQFDLSLWITQYQGHWDMLLKFRCSAFSQPAMARMAAHYAALLAQLAAGSDDAVAHLSMLSAAEQHCLLGGQGPGTAPLAAATPAGAQALPVYQQFLLQAERHPTAVALEWDAHSLSYAQLRHHVQQLASQLAALGIGKEHTVGLMMPRAACPESVIAILALWQCGAAYVALDLQHPPQRSLYMLQTARCALLLTAGERPGTEMQALLRAQAQLGVLEIVLGQALSVQVRQAVVVPPAERLEPNSPYADGGGDLAYVLYTSGSTGMPKGVLVEHAGLSERLAWMAEYFSFGPGDKFLQGTVLTFDISVPEYCLPLICGGTVVLLPHGAAGSAHVAACQAHGVTMMSTVPSLLNLLVTELAACHSLRHVISVGEALMRPVVQQWLASGTATVLHNLYGPTEATIYATFHACRALPHGSGALIGKPCPGVNCWVLDKLGRPVPAGVAGELYLGDSGVARGYIGTVRQPDPFYGNPQQTPQRRIYRTGDIVRWTAEGELDYIGRNDFRVKLRGQLIELGEIEHALLAQPGVQHACALVMEIGQPGATTRQIMAAVIARTQADAALLQRLRQRLPEYMLPSQLFQFDAFPLNSSGKVDRAALSALLTQRLAQQREQRLPATAAALTPLQQRICALWQELLQVPVVDVDENFFQLGGDSLVLTRMVLAVERTLGLRIQFGRFVSNPTINGLLAADAAEGTAPPRRAYEADLERMGDLPPFPAGATPGKAVMLTGASGHLGMHLLHALLNESSASIVLPLRGDDGMARLAARYRRLFHADLPSQRLSVLQADLALPSLGMSAADYAACRASVGQVIHAAAHVNHAADYGSMRDGNVGATRNVLLFAAQVGAAHVHHMSTQFTELADLPEAPLAASSLEAIASGYEQSKLAAELQVTQAMALGYPATVYRLPLMFDDSDTRLYTQNHFVALAVKCLQMDAYPDLPMPVTLLPTALVASYVARRSKLCTASGVRNLSLGPLAFDALAAALRPTLQATPAARWVERSRQETAEDDPFFRLLPLYADLGEPQPAQAPSRQVANDEFLRELAQLELREVRDAATLHNFAVSSLRRLAQATD
ncbi:non-ribosomal peptide synthetase/type I polyketide synthase [Janthinobacterium sp. BJB401]|uniref:non-ribosomal peptide synthetase/type I polyketide synthase n=1 Tax=Janthinobacterium sp. BJB401 TaxID=2745934 RepID=UPI001595CFB1|nr:non-ribosomal peptide synthetase/type I polyketide synthase [Janthinobacterium sp. BJB401]NVI81609.1 amino acid adenylation domain-containing protein [Janthinobacterium sp. BJB401]